MVSAEAISGTAAECRTAARLDSQGPARLRSPWLTAAIAAIGTSLAVAALGPLPYPQSLEDPWPIELLWQDGVAMQVSGYVLLACTFVGLSFSLRKRWARLRRFDYRGWRLFHGCFGVLGLAVPVMHTGMNLGVGLNRLLMLDYLGLGLAGGLMGLMIGLGEDRGPRQGAAGDSAPTLRALLAFPRIAALPHPRGVLLLKPPAASGAIGAPGPSSPWPPPGDCTTPSHAAMPACSSPDRA